MLSREQSLVLAALVALAALAWSYVIWLSGNMDVPDTTGWSLVHFLFMFAMWVVMMVGMMVPTVTPMVLIYLRVMERGIPNARGVSAAWWFVGGYLIAWTLFSLVATLAQWGLESVSLITPMMEGASDRFGGAVLTAAGIYQWMPLKRACLDHCRAPLSFIQQHGGFESSARGSLRLGFLHGMYCVGCCWSLMALLFVVGVMNILWIAALMCFVLLEKLLPRAQYFARIAGAGAVATGVWMILG